MTLYSAFECYLTEIEDNVTNNSLLKEKYINLERPKMDKRPFALFKILKNQDFDKSSKLYDDYNHFVKLRNLITHSRLESIEWENFKAKSGIWTAMKPSHSDKKEICKHSTNSKVQKDDRADKAISFLEKRKIIDTRSEFRMEGFIYSIQKIEIAEWANNMITNLMMELFDEDRTNPLYTKK
ncbi:hypothetical protein [uncultured Psychroserpens sp.]|uniref:hypothetical protein n=1 Tax=uncultured Psychroserpens sp. TaxID=255436 RepID=UPI00260FF039|nr:hypothetical protein [uncultured Psychroserpens sp.]